MPKRKLDIKSLFSGRASKETREASLAEDGGDYLSDSEGDDHFDPSAVNRPPPLDLRTEAQLRRACAVIVDNLKPSGHDIEDTRMKNDMFVEESSNRDTPPPIEQSPPSNPQPRPPAATTWFDESSARNSRVQNNFAAHDSADKRISSTLAERESYHAKRRSEHHRLSKMLKAQDKWSRPEVESPIAPAASARRASRNDDIEQLKTFIHEPVPPIPFPRDGSSSTTMSTQYTASTNGVPSNSTGVTSAQPTPAFTSKRTSDQVQTEMRRPDSSSATAGAWMKEEVDKRKQAESAACEARTGYRSGTIYESLPSADEYVQAGAASRGYDSILDDASPVSQEGPDASQARFIPLDNARSRDRAIVRPDTSKSDTSEKDRPMVRQPSMNNMTGQRNPRTGEEPIARPTSRATRRKEEKQESPEVPPVPVVIEPVEDTTTTTTNETTTTEIVPSLVEEAPASGSSSPGADAFDKTMANIKARMAATSLFSHPVDGSVSGPPQFEKDADSVTPLSPSKNGNPTSRWPVPPKSASSSERGNTSRLPPLPNNHQVDKSIIVKDFGQATAQAKQQRARSVHPVPAQTDIDAVGFDSFMNAVETKHTSDEPISPATSSRYGSPPLSAELPRITSPTTSEKPASPLRSVADSECRAPSSRSVASPTNGSFSRPLSPLATSMTQIETQTPREDLPQTSPHDQKSPPIPPIPAALRHCHSNRSLTSDPPSTSGRPSTDVASRAPLPPQPRQQSFMDFLKENSAPAADPNPTKKSDYFRIEPTINRSNGNGSAIPHQANGFSGGAPSTTNGTTTTNETPQLNGHPASPPLHSPPKIKSPRNFSISSKTSTLPPSTPAYNATAKPGLKNWLNRRRSRTLTANANAQQHGAWNSHGSAAGFTYYSADEEDDPLVCAAPIVAFGRGW